MKTELPGPIAAYFRAVNAHDEDGMLAPFAEGAVVEDEGKSRRGRAEIRAWIEEVTASYRPACAILGVTGGAPGVMVEGSVSGTFPGSPVRLRYAFQLAGGQITRLKIS
ncbi:MAG: nuclear transport factor 2 family protein [Labilithrix sp.]|nr:nuclear transport factor 2 family protein [Labilithrix sp.]MBX3216908.1 nuclear transport factor 2 family protein [Labilithrix sp.]